ncbi:hypothetical protein F4823DRAFT_561128 [Ustulina deusta]|nr:hypothetical protein F4823DRAFT_561128 [Ustulina deusta]
MAGVSTPLCFGDKLARPRPAHTSDARPRCASPQHALCAFGDVAGHIGPRMAKAGWMQAELVLENILAVINALSLTYTPNVFLDGAIKRTLDKTYSVVYANDADG